MIEVDRELRGILGPKPVDADELAKAQANLTLTLPGNWETMDAVQSVQDDATGVWWQVLDQGGREGNYLEASASCMLVYAAAKGVRLGYLGDAHLDAARKGYEGILAQFVTASADGDVTLRGTCAGTGLGRRPDEPDMTYRDGSYDYYVHRPIETNDHRGLGAFLMASVELERASGTR